MADSLILMVLALVVFGPRRLPQIGRQLGKLMYEFRKASNDFKFQMEEELRNAEEADRRKREEEESKRLALEAPAEAVSATAAVTEMHESGTGDSAGSASWEPKIQPPSTGEIVAADRPGSYLAGEAEEADEASQTGTASEPAAVQEVSAQRQSAEPQEEEPAQTPDETAPPSTEAVSHNG